MAIVSTEARERKREADRARRARIQAGQWDFPKGGAPELARAGLPIPVRPRANPSVFMSAQPARAASAPLQRADSAPPSRALTVFTPAPASTPAIGGDPRRVRGMIDPHAAARQELFLRALAARSDAQARELAALRADRDTDRRRIAALEASQAGRRADALDVAQALAGLLSFAVQRR